MQTAYILTIVNIIKKNKTFNFVKTFIIITNSLKTIGKHYIIVMCHCDNIMYAKIIIV